MKTTQLFTQITLIGILSTNLLASSSLAEKPSTTTTDTNKPNESGEMKTKLKCKLSHKSGAKVGFGHGERNAIAILSKLPENTSLQIPLGTNYPISTGNILPKDNDRKLISNLVAIGSVNKSGEVDPITSGQLIELFRFSLKNGGTLGEKSQKTNNQKVLVWDLVVMNIRNRRSYLVPNVVAYSFKRDAMNAVLNCTYRPQNIDVKKFRNL